MDKEFIQNMLDIAKNKYEGAKAFGLDCANSYESEIWKWQALLEIAK